MAGDRDRARSLLTVLFTDIVGSTSLAEELGDKRWSALLDAHDAVVRTAIQDSGGKEVKTVGDGFVATFTSPGAAIRCGHRIVDVVASLGPRVRVGIHTGEVEVRDDDLVGIGVHIAARIAALAEAGEVLVSGTVRELVAGGDFTFASRGAQQLKGVSGQRRLYSVIAKGAESATPRGRSRAPRPEPASAPFRAMRGLARTVLVDDHPLWRKTLADVVDHSQVARVVGTAGNGAEALAVVKSKLPDVVVMDIDLPVMNGLEATRQITTDNAEVKVLVLSSSNDREPVLEAVQAGARGYLLKTSGPAEIIEAIRRVHAGEVVFPPELSAVVLDAMRGRTADKAEPRSLDELTPREREVLGMMAAGKSNHAIGAALGLSPKTVDSHVAAIFSKLHLEATPDDHRRVLAVVQYLGARSGDGSPREIS